MSSNASKWFYQEPENEPYLISERVNSTFWGARMVNSYWRCVRAESPFKVHGFLGDEKLILEWVPNEWLKLTAPPTLDAVNFDTVVNALSNRILAFDPSFTYEDADGNRYYEWHLDESDQRWSELQGRAGFVEPRRL